MKKFILFACSCLLLVHSYAQLVNTVYDPVEWVNPLMGTDSKPSLSNGNTYPAIAVPWGMNFWVPQTNNIGDGWQYQYAADKIKGFKQTHRPSPWMNDYGQFSIMPITGKARFKQNDRASWFSHKTEIAKPYYYQVYLADANVTAEVTPTERAAQFRFTYPATDSAFLVIDAFDKGSYIKVLPNERKIVGYTTRNSGGVTPNFKNHFVIHLSKAFNVTYLWQDSLLMSGGFETHANHAGAVIGFATGKNEKVNVKVLQIRNT